MHDCNIGLAYARLGRLARAHWFLGRCERRWADTETEPLPAWVPARIDETASALRAGGYALGTVEVSPATATLAISTFEDDEPVAGIGRLWLPAGSHRVRVTATDRAARTVDVVVRAGEPFAIRVRLEPDRPAPVVEPPPEPLGDPRPNPIAPAERDQASDDDSRGRGGMWAALALGGSAAAVGAFVALDARDDVRAAEELAGDVPRFDELDDRVRTKRVVAYSLYAVSAIGFGTAYYLFRRSEQRKSRARAGLVPRAGGAAAWVSWEF